MTWANDGQGGVRLSGGEVFWLSAVCSGAVGGFSVSAAAFCGDISAWQEERHRRRASGTSPLPGISAFTDPVADPLVLLTRIGLGAVAGWVFRDQVVSSMAAIAAGASAPALLAQLGRRSLAAPAPDYRDQVPARRGTASGALDSIPAPRAEADDVSPLAEDSP